MIIRGDNHTEKTGQESIMASKRSYAKILSYVVLILLVILGAGAYWWRDKTAKSEELKLKSQIASLEKDNADLDKRLEDASKPDISAETLNDTLLAKLTETIETVFASGNTAALEGHMAGNVNVIIAASEGLGKRTSAQAVADITAYMKNATVPWDFNLPAEILTEWGSGDYASYFPRNSIIGRSDKIVMSFIYSTSYKITGVFMSISDDLL